MASASAPALADTIPHTPGSDTDGSSEDEFHCAQAQKRVRPDSPPIRLAPPTREEIVEWIYSFSDEHPVSLVARVAFLRGLATAYEGTLAQQIDETRRTMVHFSRLLLLAYGEAPPEGPPQSGLRQRLRAMSSSAQLWILIAIFLFVCVCL